MTKNEAILIGLDEIYIVRDAIKDKLQDICLSWIQIVRSGRGVDAMRLSWIWGWKCDVWW